jgi:hypothetical protein
MARFATSPPTDNCPQPKEAQPLSQLDIRLIQHFDSSALWFDGPEVALNWAFPYPILPPGVRTWWRSVEPTSWHTSSYRTCSLRIMVEGSPRMCIIT